MEWFDGTYQVCSADFECFFPKKVATDIYQDEFGKRALLVFDLDSLKKDSWYSTVQRFDHEGNNLLFYFPIFGKNAPKVAAFLKNTCSQYKSASVDDQRSQLMERLKEKNVLSYVYREHEHCHLFLRRDAFSEDSYLILLVGRTGFRYTYFGAYEYVDALRDNFLQLIRPENTFTPIPLKRLMFRCPVCGAKSLESRGDFEICHECGWEDDGTDDIDSETGPNGGWTIRTYRIHYFKNRIKNPAYRWWHGPEEPCDRGEFFAKEQDV